MKALKLKALSFIFIILAAPLFSLMVQPVEATATASPIVGGTTQYKEHNYQNSSRASITVFSQSNASFGGFTGYIEIDSGGLAPQQLSQNFIMITFQKSLLSGAHYNTRFDFAVWFDAGGGANNEFSVVLWDKSWLRSASNVFVNASALDFQGVSQPTQTLINSSVAGFHNVSVALNAGGSGKYFTFVFFSADYDAGWPSILRVMDLKLVNTSDSSVMYHNDFQCTLVSELAGTFNDYGYCGTDSGDPPLIGIFTSLDGFTVTNLEPCGNWAYAEAKYYNFQLTIGGSNVTDTVLLQFNDGLTNITFRYDHISRIPDHVSGSNVTTMGTVTAVTNSTNFMTLTFPVLFLNTVLDSLKINVTAKANDTNGFDTGWTSVGNNTFNIYNLGGLVQTVSTGTAGRIPGGDTFEIQAANLTSIFVNQTFRKIQQFRSQFSVALFDEAANTGFVIGFQDFTHSNGGAELYLDKGDWTVEIAMNYCDTVDNVMVKGFYVIFMMEEGDLGVNDEWTIINSTWYDRDDIIIKSDLFTIWPETELAITRLWIDLWYNKINSSSIGGGRLNGYYTGMDTTAFLLWQGGWAPFITNGTDSMAFIPLKNNASEFITSPQLDLMSVSFNLTRPANSIGTEGRNITVSLKNYAQLDYKFAFGQMQGIDTPVPVETKVPDMPVTGFFTPLIAAVLSIGGNIMNAFIEIGLTGWFLILSQFPGLDAFIINITALLTSSILLATTLIGFVVGLFSWMAGFVQFLGIPVNAVIDIVVVFTDLANTLVPEGSRVGIVTILVLMQLMALVDDLAKGDTGKVWRFGQSIWNMSETIINIAVKMANFTIRVINAVNPF